MKMSMFNVLTVLAVASGVSSIAGAEEKAPGAFIPAQCAMQGLVKVGPMAAAPQGISQVCIGKLADSGKEAVEVSAGSRVSVYQVEIKGAKPSGGMGSWVRTFEGSMIQNPAQTVTGFLPSSSGMTAIDKIQLSTSEGLHFDGILHAVSVSQEVSAAMTTATTGTADVSSSGQGWTQLDIKGDAAKAIYATLNVIEIPDLGTKEYIRTKTGSNIECQVWLKSIGSSAQYSCTMFVNQAGSVQVVLPPQPL